MENIKQKILKEKPIKLRWLIKFFSSQRFTKSDYYWKLKSLFRKGFDIKTVSRSGYLVRDYRIFLLGEYSNIRITDNFEDICLNELDDKIDEAFKELYDNFIARVNEGSTEELEKLYEIDKKYK